MTTRVPTYETFVIHTIMPALGWQAVYYTCETGLHFVAPIHALALVTRRTRLCLTADLCPPASGDETEEESREIVGIDYHPADGWTICDDDDNYCGLLVPGSTLAEFETMRECRHEPAAQEVPQP
jgi:hypothetical protein